MLLKGDIVQVKKFKEILNTLDLNRTLDGLPFMPEMLEFCNKSFVVSHHVTQAVIDSAGVKLQNESYVRKFRNADVDILENLRCSGENHDNCKRGCMIFWKEAWLKKVDFLNSEPVEKELQEAKKLLKTKTILGKYHCQSTQFLEATNNLSYMQRIINCLVNLRYGNYKISKLFRILSIWTFWKTRRKLFGRYPRGIVKTTPTETINLQSQEWVEVKSLSEIKATLDVNGCNRGLHFSADMVKYCGKRFKVRARADKLISESTGLLQTLKNTVILEGTFCDSAYYAFGGCPRNEFLYWREIWLKRVIV